jgi:6-pyruvoyltetrahydropterin/6-carboxytetrahydropterin synthase
MLSLRRTVRFSLTPGGRGFEAQTDNRHRPQWPNPDVEPRHNPYAGWPASQTASGIGAYVSVDVELRGEPDPTTGYLVNITVIDSVVRQDVVPWLTTLFAEQFQSGSPIEPCAVARELALRMDSGIRRALADAPSAHPIGGSSAARPPRPCATAAVTLHVAPTVSHRYDFDMPNQIEIRQQFEFSASHRLHCSSLDDATNRAVFGKCNNPHGHGHNYRLEVGAAVSLDARPPLPVGTLDRIVDETVLRRLDHKHLNLDVPEFADLNPSVEHIAKVCYDLLAPALAAAGAIITTVTVWETEKTCCTYPAR